MTGSPGEVTGPIRDVVVDRYDLRPEYSISRLIHGGWQFSAGHRLSATALDDTINVLETSTKLKITTFTYTDIYTNIKELFKTFLKQ